MPWQGHTVGQAVGAAGGGAGGLGLEERLGWEGGDLFPCKARGPPHGPIVRLPLQEKRGTDACRNASMVVLGLECRELTTISPITIVGMVTEIQKSG